MNFYNLFCLLTTLCSTRMTVSTTQSPIIFRDDDNLDDLEMPVNFAQLLNKVTSEDELMNFMNISSRPPEVISARFGGPIQRSKAITMAKMASCIPEETTINLKPATADVAIFYYPPCTRVTRCGGCCSHDLLSCQPVEVEIQQLGVIISEYKGGNQLVYRGRDIISIEKHKSCKCDCRIKASDCQPYQKYSKESCRCVCANYDAQEKCSLEAPMKLWNPNECSCVCRDIQECSSGFYFDRYTCKCVAERSRRYNTTDWDRLSYNVN